MTDAEKWLIRFRNGEIEAPNVDTINFDDKSSVVWDGQIWRGDPFGAFKNPDGKTYNGLAFFSKLTGIPEDVIQADLEKARNARKKD